MSTKSPYLPAILTAAGLVGGAYCAYSIYQAYKKKLPENWTQVGTIQNIYVYPIKSCAPVLGEDVECTHMGLRDSWLRDRVLMIVDKKRNFITARGYPNLLLIQPSIKGSVLTLKYKDMKPVSVNLAEVQLKPHETAQVWGTTVPVQDCGEEANKWLSRLLLGEDIGLQLVHYASEKCRVFRDKNTLKFFNFTKNDTGALPDETSYHLINEASVQDLNNRLVDKITHLNFRPNFVVDGAQPLDEDNWKFIKIGDNVFEIIKPCGRCILTTIDPETGIKSAKTEPLETLKTYRQIDDPAIRKLMGNSPRMGVQMALRSGPGGRIKLNDPVYRAD